MHWSLQKKYIDHRYFEKAFAKRALWHVKLAIKKGTAK